MKLTKETTAKDILAVIDEWALIAPFSEQRKLYIFMATRALIATDHPKEEDDETPAL